jgi:uncharacterized delta-60 repeat protein
MMANTQGRRIKVSMDRGRTDRAWRAALALACVVAAMATSVVAPAAAKPGAAAKSALAGRLDPSFGKGGKALIAFAAENAGDVGVKYDLPFQFTAGHLVMSTSPGGKYVVAGGTRVVRLLANGKPDRRFGSAGVVSIPRPPGLSFVLAGAAVDSQGRVLLAGSSRPLPTGSIPDPLLSSATVMRLNSDGSPDTSFGNGGTLVSDFGLKPPLTNTGPYKGAAVGLRSIAVDSLDRPLLSGGSVTKVVSGCGPGETAVSTGFVARLTANGSQDPGFAEAGLRQIPEFSSFEQAGLLPGGTLLAVGLGKPRCADEGGGPAVVLTGFGPEGNLEPGFGFAGFRVLGYKSAPVVSIAPSGKILLLGAKQKDSQLVMRLLPNGAADPGFGRTGRVNVVPPPHAAIAALTTDGRERLLFAGRITKRASKSNPVARSSFLLGRMNPKGSFDRGFGRKGSVRTGFGGPSSSFATQVLVDAKGRIVVGGGVTTSALGTGGGFAIARYLGGR